MFLLNNFQFIGHVAASIQTDDCTKNSWMSPKCRQHFQFYGFQCESLAIASSKKFFLHQVFIWKLNFDYFLSGNLISILYLMTFFLYLKFDTIETIWVFERIWTPKMERIIFIIGSQFDWFFFGAVNSKFLNTMKHTQNDHSFH